jgi:hypothetical protein
VNFYAGPFSRQPKIETTIAEKAVSIRDATVAALKGEEYKEYEPPSKMNLDKALEIAGSVLGGIAFIPGVLGYANESPRELLVAQLFWVRGR